MTAEEQGKKIDEMNWIFESFRETLEKIREGGEGNPNTVSEVDESWE